MTTEIKGDVYNVTNGDHVILIIDDENKENAVVCDPWLGKVYPYSFLITKLRTHGLYSVNFSDMDCVYNITNSYNPLYHSLEIVNIIDHMNIIIHLPFPDLTNFHISDLMN